MEYYQGNHGIEPVPADSRVANVTSDAITKVPAASASTVDVALAKPVLSMDATAAFDPPILTGYSEHASQKQPSLSSAASVRRMPAGYCARPAHLTQPHRHSKPAISETSYLPPWIKGFVQLPVELQIMILEFVGFGGIEQLRRTCKFLRQHISKSLIHAIFQDRLDEEIRFTCIHCLQPGRWAAEIIVPNNEHDATGFTSRCVPCLLSQKALNVDVRYKHFNGNYSYVCRLCGYPVMLTDGVAGERQHLHHHCNEEYQGHCTTFFLVRMLLAMIHICAFALCWAFYKSQPVTLGCTTGAFFMSIWGMMLFYFRSRAKIIDPRTRTWHWSLILELGNLASWLVILYDIRYPMVGTRPRRRGTPAAATLGFVILIILIRTLNVIGLTLMTFEVKYWRRLNATGDTKIRSWLAGYVTFFFIWTSSNAVFQKYPPVWAKVPPLWREQPVQPQLQPPLPAHVTGSDGEMV